MKRFTLLFLFLLVASTAVFAQQAPATPPAAPAAAAAPKPAPVPGTKIATIDFRKALVESDPGALAAKDYEKEMATQNGKLEKLAKEVTELQEKLKNAKTDTEKNDFTKQIGDKQKEGQRVQEDASQMAEDLQAKLLPPIAAMVNKALEAYSLENGLAVVIDPSTEPNNVVYAAPATDVTTEIMRRVNAEFAKNPKAAAPATAAPAANRPPAATAPK